MSQRWSLAIILIGLAVAAGAYAAWATCVCGKLAPEGQVSRLVTGLSFIAVGVVALRQAGTERVGTLMTIVGFAWFVDDLGWIYHPLPYSLARFGAAFFQPVLAHLMLAFPSGRLANRFERGVVGAGYGLTFISTLALAAVWDAADAGCPGCPRNLLLVHRDPELHDIMEEVATGVSLSFTALVLGLLARHWAMASVPRRRALAPVLCSSLPLGGAIAVYSLVGRSAVPPVAPLALTLLPLGFLVGLLRIRLSRAAVGGLVVALDKTPPPTRLREALAHTLHDPSLQVAYWLPGRSAFVDDGGQAVVLPAPGSGRAAILLERDGQPLGALIHDVAVAEDPQLMEAAAAAARLAIDNEHLHAEINARLREVRASRTRMVEAADAERRRIERNLHDGSQQRLVTLSIALGMARARLIASGNAEVLSMLDEAVQQLHLAMSELRELARGIHPAILSEAGLGPALQSLAERSSLPVDVRLTLGGRLPPHVEAAVYFLVAEALTNAGKHAGAARASVCARHCDGQLIVEVADDGRGGADPAAGSGLQGLLDRVGALDGRLEVDSPPGGGTRVVARIPCTPPVAADAGGGT